MTTAHEEALLRLAGQNILVLDLETMKSADDCAFCGEPEGIHQPLSGGALCRRDITMVEGSTFTKTGWANKRELGLSIGCYFSYTDMQLHWFDTYTLEQTVLHFVDTQPLLVSFNGIQFDFALMRALLRYNADALHVQALPGGMQPGDGRAERANLHGLCDMFKAHCHTSYDILAEIWKVDTLRKFERGLNSLDAIAQANGFGAKLMNGAIAPRLWQQGRVAEVVEYCADDVHKTRRLFEKIVAGQPILRGDGLPIMLPAPRLTREVPHGHE